MSITALNRKRSKTIAGNRPSVYIAKKGWIEAVTYDATLTNYPKIESITMAATKEFVEIQGDIDGVMLDSEGQGGLNYFTNQTLQIKMTAKRKELEALIKELKEDDGEDVNEFVIIRVDEENNVWMSGITREDLQMIEQSWIIFKDPFASGKSVEDVDEGNKYTLTFERLSGVRESEIIDDAITDLKAGILAGTSDIISYAT